MNDLEIPSLLESGSFTAYGLENAAFHDSRFFYEVFLEEIPPKAREWMKITHCEEFVFNLYSNSFMFGVCHVVKAADERSCMNFSQASACYRPMLFGQIIVPDKGLRDWIDKADCMDFVYSVYESSFILGAIVMERMLNDYIIE